MLWSHKFKNQSFQSSPRPLTQASHPEQRTEAFWTQLSWEQCEMLEDSIPGTPPIVDLSYLSTQEKPAYSSKAWTASEKPPLTSPGRIIHSLLSSAKTFCVHIY
jgi:hypothetical protein